MDQAQLTDLSSKQQKRTIELLLALNSSITDSMRKEIPLMHRRYKPGESYDSAEYVYFINPDTGSIDLYMASRNITNSSSPPNVATSPASWKKV